MHQLTKKKYCSVITFFDGIPFKRIVFNAIENKEERQYEFARTLSSVDGLQIPFYNVLSR